ncbi:MAG TPA: SDR family NAD(P)-dependent oxidoreductase, partial [Stellaceae bacterium]|nr:SDR family NAD(P)-dependent oxidoreductase [Stellaceae bacterium]
MTGGSLGIGFAVARGFLAEGCHVTIAARDEARLASAVERLSQVAPGRVAPHAVDLSRRGAPEALAEAHPDTDILVNNAGAIPTGDIFDIDETRWREAWDLKVFGYVNLTRAMYRLMRGRPPKVIVNVIGTGAEQPQFRYACGNAANIALNGLTRSLGGRSLDDGIRVVGVNPGAVDTERWRSIHQGRAETLLGDRNRW